MFLMFSFLQSEVQADSMLGTEPLLMESVYAWHSSRNIWAVSVLPFICFGFTFL